MIEAKHRVAALVMCIPPRTPPYVMFEYLPDSHPVWGDLLRQGMLDENYRITDTGARWLRETLR